MRATWCLVLVCVPMLAPPAEGVGPARGGLELMKGNWEYRWHAQKKADRDLLSAMGLPPDAPGLFESPPPAAVYNLNVGPGVIALYRGPELVLRQVGVRLGTAKDPRAIDLTI